MVNNTIVRLSDRHSAVPGPSRRTFLRGTIATGVLAATGGIVLAQDEAPDADIVLEARIGGWRGERPENIDGETNPPLMLEAGQEYTVAWVNHDGFRHNFVIIDAEGQQVVRTPVVAEEDEVVRVTFTATEDMFEYFCEIHPAAMRGPVLVGGTQPEDGTGSPIPLGDTVGIETIATGLTSPLAFAVAPGDPDHRYIVDQVGVVHVHGPNGLEDGPFLDISDRIVDLGVEELNGYDERGLLGLAFHPDYATNGRFYVRYSAPRRPGTPENYDHTEVLSEFTVTDDFDPDDPETERVLLELPSPQMNHNGGALEFGPDGLLYTSVGDGGAANDVGLGHVDDWYDVNEGGNGQDVEANLLGSVLRIDVDRRTGDLPYGIPEDNPLGDEQFAWGFRNPWRMSFNDVPGGPTGKLFVGDAGQNLWEEVSIVERGGNYGWNVREGTHCFSTANPSDPEIADCPTTVETGPRTDEELLDPVIEYRHRRSTTAFIDGSVVIGGYTYEGDTVDVLKGTYVFGNWSGDGVIQPDGEVFVATPPTDDARTWSVEELRIAGTPNERLNRYVLGFGRDAAGELYVLTSMNFTPTGETGAVHRLVRA